MIWVRKAIVFLLSLLLFFTLLDGVLATSIDIALSQPAKLETWLNQSGLYSSFIQTAIKQANSSASNNSQSNSVSLNDTAVQQAAESAFSPTLLQQDVNTFLNSNYAWLEGKTATPVFVINLTSAKQDFAQQVGQYVDMYLSNLPACTSAQTLVAAQTTDPLLLTCRPNDLNPAAAGAQVAQQLASNSGFLGNTVITAKSFNPNGRQSRPYYQQFSAAPKIYQLATKAPLAFAALAILCLLGIIFIAPKKRKGFRKILFVLLEVGIILVAVKFATNIVIKRVENKVFNHVSDGPLQHALTNFAQRVIAQLNTVNFYFGIACIILAVIIIVILVATRNRDVQPVESTDTPVNPPAQPVVRKPATDVMPRRDPINPTSSTPPRPKRPRLIQ